MAGTHLCSLRCCLRTLALAPSDAQGRWSNGSLMNVLGFFSKFHRVVGCISPKHRSFIVTSSLPTFCAPTEMAQIPVVLLWGVVSVFVDASERMVDSGRCRFFYI